VFVQSSHTKARQNVSMCDCFALFREQEVEAVDEGRTQQRKKIVVQGERAKELKRRPESIQHFLFLVSVFLFGERDLYCRARGDFARVRKARKKGSKGVHQQVHPRLEPATAREKIFLG
jgi:hypothetical protein